MLTKNQYTPPFKATSVILPNCENASKVKKECMQLLRKSYGRRSMVNLPKRKSISMYEMPAVLQKTGKRVAIYEDENSCLNIWGNDKATDMSIFEMIKKLFTSSKVKICSYIWNGKHLINQEVFDKNNFVAEYFRLENITKD